MATAKPARSSSHRWRKPNSKTKGAHGLWALFVLLFHNQNLWLFHKQKSESERQKNQGIGKSSNSLIFLGSSRGGGGLRSAFEPENCLGINFYYGLLVKKAWMEAVGMKVTRELRKLTTTQTEMARVLGISQQRVSQLLQEEVMAVDDDGGLLVVESLKNFYKLRKGPASSGEEPDYMEEKALHERVKREIAELKLAKMENSVYDAKTVELVMTEQLSNLRTQLLGLPSKLAPIIEGKSKEEIYETMTREIEEKLMELSEYTPELFTEEFVEDDDEEVE